MNPIFQTLLDKYETANSIEEENAAKEVIQEIALYGLWRAKFFDVAVVQGGTSLRILHQLPRFSEDLYFMLLKPDPDFNRDPYLKILTSTFEKYGLKPEMLTKAKKDKRIQRAAIKDSSVANQLDLSFGRRDKRKNSISNSRLTFNRQPLLMTLLHFSTSQLTMKCVIRTSSPILHSKFIHSCAVNM